LRVLWFPFLITAFVLTIVVFFGRLKTKAVLKNGKTYYISNQWSIVTIIALVAIVLTVAVVVQVALAIYYFNAAVFVLSLVILLAMIGFNVYWAIWYYNNFFKTRKPRIGERITVKGRTFDVQTETQQNKKENEVALDKGFHDWCKKHKFSSWSIYILAAVFHWQATKMYYGRFYMFDMFKGNWTNPQKLREFQDKYQFCYLAVYILIIIIGIVGLIMIPSLITQLWITLIETIVLSIYLIILMFIERFYILKIFEYVEHDRKLKTSKAMKKANVKQKGKGNSLQIKNLKAKIGKSSKTFKQNKWEDLLEEFGGRRCKSMIDLSTGWDKE
jgi:hypothetical protein